MNNIKQPTRKVVPFKGEMWEEVPATPTPTPNSDYSILAAYIALSLIAGLCVGAILTYQSTDQQQLRDLKQQSSQLQKVKSEVCK